jgi:hypothetical protein
MSEVGSFTGSTVSACVENSYRSACATHQQDIRDSGSSWTKVTNLLGEDNAPIEERRFGVVNEQCDAVLVLVVKVRVHLRLPHL